VTTDGSKTIAYNANADLPWTSTSQARAKVISIDTMVTVTLPGGVPLELVYIAPGTFTMGSPPGELSRLPDETQFDVQLTSGTYMGKTELTQKQWLAVMGSWPGTAPAAATGLGDNHPAYYVSWNDAQNFLTSVTAYLAATGQGPMTMRLPTEAEWEYACRAGTTTRFSFGDGFGADESCSAEAERVDNMWYCGNQIGGSKVVGTKPANPFGLCDMHGNVWEWCQDWSGTYPTSPPTQVNPTGPSTGSNRVDRGGNWDSYVRNCRSALRHSQPPTIRLYYLGFRVLAVR
jgi:formylglycine-generating enzyme required for sulfatase activity